MKSVLIPSEAFNVSEISLSYNPKVKASDRVQIQCPDDTYKLLNQHWDTGKLQLVEQFKVIMLNNSNKVLGIYELSTGGITSTIIDLRVLYSAVLLAHAVKIILAHNHPSGSLRPSQPDLRMTESIKAAGKILNIDVVDHIIITAESYFSFANEGLL